MLSATYGEADTKKFSVFDWHKMFKKKEVLGVWKLMEEIYVKDTIVTSEERKRSRLAVNQFVGGATRNR